MDGVTTDQMLRLAEQTKMLHLTQEIKKLAEKSLPQFNEVPQLNLLPLLTSLPSTSVIPGLDLPFLNPNPNLLQILLNQMSAFNFAQSSLIQSSVIEVNPAHETSRRRRLASESTIKKQESMDDDQETFIASSEKEGWCRNKKYIEKTENGFMCTVCKKVYGRYNSVSYHVTIYHRNPPIKCDMGDCQFATREARYIHFHKYYRHGVPLPESIDQGSRKCPHCKHVSKSPAMLEKHIRRHLQDRPSSVSSPSMASLLVDIESRPRAISELIPPLEPVIDVCEEEEKEHEIQTVSNEEQYETKSRAFTL
ncbi:unnamed protein product, partial [Mesorhabditis belari]|uniref:C2H2-type domain-containing protein n=1 Tax=Mesorhabditis belari TaxID=2138241 RepID=A0AAF3ETZ2_9BILA